MRFLLAALLIATAPAAHAQSKPADILNAEMKFWIAYTSGDSAALTRQFAPDFLNVEQQIWDGPKVASFARAFHAQCSLAPVKIMSSPPASGKLPNPAPIQQNLAPESCTSTPSSSL